MNFIANLIRILSIFTYSAAAILIIYYFLKENGLIKFHIKLPLRTSDQSDLPVQPEQAGRSGYPVQPGRSGRSNQSNLSGSSDLPDLSSRRDNLNIFLKIALFSIATRIVIFIIGYMAQALFMNQGGNILNTFKSTWNRWDSPHYLYLAENWYAPKGTENDVFIVFYPLYPMLVKLISVVFFLKNYFVSGVIVSNICLIFACFYLYKLVSLEFDRLLSRESVKYMLIFPFSFFFGISFTESLFLMLTIMFFYYIRKGDWYLAGAAGLFAALTKNQGVLLIVPAFIEFVYQTGMIKLLAEKQFKRILTLFMRKGIFIFLIPSGTFMYLLLNKTFMGSWFAFITVQKQHWYNGFGFFADTIRYIIINSFTWDPPSRMSLWIPQVFTFIFITILIFYSFNKLRLSYIAYTFAYTLVSFSSVWLLSSPRYIAGLFPVYILLGMLAKNKNAERLLSFISIMLLCFYTLAFVTGKNIM